MTLTIIVLTALCALAYGFLVGVFVGGTGQKRARNKRHTTALPAFRPKR